MKTISIVSLVLFLVTTSHSAIIAIPDDFESIQAGIDQAESADTILIAPGTYTESISLMNKALTIAGQFLFSRDPADIEATILDGDNNFRVFTIGNGCSGSTITGLTIQNGNAEHGGGLLIASEIQLSHLVIRNNHASGNGGGIYCSGVHFNGADLTIIENTADNGGAGISQGTRGLNLIRSLVARNVSDGYGGGIYSSPSWGDTTRLKDVALVDNVAGSSGGGMDLRTAVMTGYTLECENVTIANNRSGSGGGGAAFHARLVNCLITNSIIWGNAEPTLSVDNQRSNHNFTFDYTNFIVPEEIGGDSGEVDWYHPGDGMIAEDPQFIDPGAGNYDLRENSPCIDAGDPDSPPDSDGSRADMGARLDFGTTHGMLSGTITRAQNNEPIVNASVTTSLGQTATSDNDGFWQIENAIAGVFTVSVIAHGYADYTTEELVLEADGELVVDVGLLHAEFSATNVIDEELYIDEKDTITVAFENAGDYPLIWTSKKIADPLYVNDPWTEMAILPLENSLQLASIGGLAAIGDSLYISAAPVDDWLVGRIYVVDMDGSLGRSFLRPVSLDDHRSDIEWDGELLWAGGYQSLVGMNTEGDSITSIQSPFSRNSHIAWDGDHNVFWVLDHSMNEPFYITAIDREGNVLDQIEIELWAGSLFYFPDDPDGYCLYTTTRIAEREDVYKVVKYNVETGERIDAFEFPLNYSGFRGASLVRNFDRYNHAVAYWAENAIIDPDELCVSFWSLAGNTDWMTLIPNEGVVQAGGVSEVELVLDASYSDEPYGYDGEIWLYHNAVDEYHVILVHMEIVELNAGVSDPALPLTLELKEPFPNPFNSMTQISYTIPSEDRVTLKVYDSAGRLVETLFEGFGSPGEHSLAWSSNGVACGLYYIVLEGTDFRLNRKAVLLK